MTNLFLLFRIAAQDTAKKGAEDRCVFAADVMLVEARGRLVNRLSKKKSEARKNTTPSCATDFLVVKLYK